MKQGQKREGTYYIYERRHLTRCSEISSLALLILLLSGDALCLPLSFSRWLFPSKKPQSRVNSFSATSSLAEASHRRIVSGMLCIVVVEGSLRDNLKWVGSIMKLSFCVLILPLPLPTFTTADHPFLDEKTQDMTRHSH